MPAGGASRRATPEARGWWSVPGRVCGEAALSAPLSPLSPRHLPIPTPCRPPRCAAQARSEVVSVVTEPGPGAWRARRGARGRERGLPAGVPGSARSRAAPPAAGSPRLGLRGPSAGARAPRPLPPRSCAWAGGAGPGDLVSVRQGRAGRARSCCTDRGRAGAASNGSGQEIEDGVF